MLGIYRTSPYLHRGKAATLVDVLTSQNADDQHGMTCQLSEADTMALVEFLKALPYEDPSVEAEAVGLMNVQHEST